MTDDASVRMLTELTGLPTAAGREGHVIDYIKRWCRRQRGLRLRADGHGNLIIKRTGVNSRRPIVLAAHMDHPAFVVTRVEGSHVHALFRGGVHTSYFLHSRVVVEPRGVGGTIVDVVEGEDGRNQRVRVEMDAPADAAPGAIMRWDLPRPRIEDDRLHAPACDDLAGVAAALQALGELAAEDGLAADVRVLLTRAEEVGFIGAMAACRSGLLPRAARVVALENSKAFDDSPLAAGPILRVGDKTATFDPDLTYRLGQVAEELARHNDAAFTYQRKLMPGGTCEASAYQAYGYRAACLCLPLGNYHNMNEAAGRIDSETISVGDYRALVAWLVAVARRLDAAGDTLSLRTRLDDLFARRAAILEEDPAADRT